MLLIPGLLFALKACCMVYFSSVGVICCSMGAVSGVNFSTGIAGSWNKLLLCAVKSSNFSALMS